MLCLRSVHSCYVDVNTKGQFLDSITKIAYIFLGLGGIAFLASLGEMTLLNLSATRQIRRARNAYFRALLRQDIGWFDLSTAGDLSSRLAEYGCWCGFRALRRRIVTVISDDFCLFAAGTQWRCTVEWVKNLEIQFTIWCGRGCGLFCPMLARWYDFVRIDVPCVDDVHCGPDCRFLLRLEAHAACTWLCTVYGN